MPQYLSTDPNVGEPLQPSGGGYLSTDPNAGEPVRQRPEMNFAIVNGERVPVELEGSAAGRFASNLWEQVNPVTMVKGLAQAVAHPIDTAGAIAGAHKRQFQKAGTAFTEGRYSEAVGHGLAGVLPLVGPAAADVGEQIASGDIAGGAGAATGLVASVLGVRPIARGGVNAARRVAPSGALDRAATFLEKGAAERIADVMSPRVGPNKTRFGNMAEKVAPTLAEDASLAALSREGFHAKIGERRALAEQALDAAADARVAARTFETRPLIDALLEKRRELTSEAVRADRPMPVYEGRAARAARTPDEFSTSGDIRVDDIPAHRRGFRTLDEEPGRFAREPERVGAPVGQDVVPGPNAARVAVLDQAIAELRRLGPVARYEPIRVMRQAYDGPAKAVYSPAVTADFLKAQGGKLGAADVTGVLREHLAKWDPQTAVANAEYSLYRTADDVLEATREIERVRPKVGRQIAARFGGAVAGGQAAGAAGAVTGYVLGPVVEMALSSGLTTKLHTARLMSTLAKAIRNGTPKQVDSVLLQLRRLAMRPGGIQTGRLGETVGAMAADDQATTPAATVRR